MKFVLIFGPHAVGKMTVGQELAKVTDLKLFHNHMTIDLVSPFFPYKTKTGKRLVRLFRREFFKEVAKSDLEGIIFTYVWKFSKKISCDIVKSTCEIFESQGGEVYFVELEADLDERLKRNKHPHRLKCKPLKNDIAREEKLMKDTMKKHRLNSKRGELKRKNYIRIDNTNLKPKEVAKIIKDRFNL